MIQDIITSYGNYFSFNICERSGGKYEKCVICPTKQSGQEMKPYALSRDRNVICLTLTGRYPWRPRENQITVTLNISLTGHQTGASGGIVIFLFRRQETSSLYILCSIFSLINHIKVRRLTQH